VITVPKWLLPTDRFDVRLRLLPGLANPLKHGATVSIFTGSAETIATIHLLDKDHLAAGESSVAQVTVSGRLALVKGDHFIIRSPMATLGGGIVIDPYAKRHKRFRNDIVDKIEEKETGALESVVLNFVEGSPLSKAADIAVKCNLSPEIVAGALEILKSDGRLIVFGKEREQSYLTSEAWNKIAAEAITYVNEFHRSFPTRPGMPRGELASKLKLSANSPVLLRLFQDALLVEEGSTARLPSFKIKFSAEQEKKAAEFMAQVAKNPYSPQVDIVLEKDMMNQLLEQKKVVRVSENVFYLPEVYEEMVGKISSYIREKGKITAAEVRDLFNTSRKYAVALLEYMDEKKITRRVGDDRVLR
jgi:selenocysteine-specific elongation factor